MECVVAPPLWSFLWILQSSPPLLCRWPAAASCPLFPKWGYACTLTSVQAQRQGRNVSSRRCSIFLALPSQLGWKKLWIAHKLCTWYLLQAINWSDAAQKQTVKSGLSLSFKCEFKEILVSELLVKMSSCQIHSFFMYYKCRAVNHSYIGWFKTSFYFWLGFLPWT